jgi:hypothetical protein
MGAFMTQQTKNQQTRPEQTYPAPSDKEKKQRAEEHEVAGRHKNDGQKDHKGAR